MVINKKSTTKTLTLTKIVRFATPAMKSVLLKRKLYSFTSLNSLLIHAPQKMGGCGVGGETKEKCDKPKINPL